MLYWLARLVHDLFYFVISFLHPSLTAGSFQHIGILQWLWCYIQQIMLLPPQMFIASTKSQLTMLWFSCRNQWIVLPLFYFFFPDKSSNGQSSIFLKNFLFFLNSLRVLIWKYFNITGRVKWDSVVNRLERRGFKEDGRQCTWWYGDEEMGVLMPDTARTDFCLINTNFLFSISIYLSIFCFLSFTRISRVILDYKFYKSYKLTLSLITKM